ncbi:transcription antitermination factor NusB [Persephonella sp.]
MGKFRKKAREIVFRTLYTYDIKGGDLFEIMEDHIKDVRENLSEKTLGYVYATLKGLEEHLPEVDETIKEHLKNWRLERLGYPERALLRLGVYELLFSDIEDKGRVFIDVLDLTKCYINNQDTVKFINGILSTIYKNHQKIGS